MMPSLYGLARLIERFFTQMRFPLNPACNSNSNSAIQNDGKLAADAIRIAPPQPLPEVSEAPPHITSESPALWQLSAKPRHRSTAACVLEADISTVEDLGWNSFKICYRMGNSVTIWL